MLNATMNPETNSLHPRMRNVDVCKFHVKTEHGGNLTLGGKMTLQTCDLYQMMLTAMWNVECS